jgi:thymidylate synthase (FAD)
MEIKVLDHGHVRLVDSMGNDLSIVRNARVSHDAAWRTGEDAGKDEKLIKYLYKHNHNTPFESVVLTFEVKAPIFVIRQWHRHRTWSYNEISARYTEVKDEFYVPDPRHVGKQSGINHQSREIEVHYKATEHQKAVTSVMYDHNEDSFNIYKALLDSGVPRELARTVLPVATYTTMFGTVNLHNLFRFLHERLDSGAQWEIRQYALALLELIKPIAPIAVGCFQDELNANL